MSSGDEMGVEKFWRTHLMDNSVEIEVSSKIAPPDYKKDTRIFIDFYGEGVFHPMSILQAQSVLHILTEAVQKAIDFHAEDFTHGLRG